MKLEAARDFQAEIAITERRVLDLLLFSSPVSTRSESPMSATVMVALQAVCWPALSHVLRLSCSSER